MNSTQKKTSKKLFVELFKGDISETSAEELVDFLIEVPTLCECFKKRLFVQPNPKDIFILALTELRDTGDIDCLVRALHWQQNTIDSLRYDVDHYHKSLLKLDALRIECSRLQHNLGVVRSRNAELIRALQEQHCKIPKRGDYGKEQKKDTRSRR